MREKVGELPFFNNKLVILSVNRFYSITKSSMDVVVFL